MLDLGAKLGICRRCTCPVHEADITDGYAEVCTDNPAQFECLQSAYADSCLEYGTGHPEDVAAMRAAPDYSPPPEATDAPPEAQEGEEPDAATEEPATPETPETEESQPMETAEPDA